MDSPMKYLLFLIIVFAPVESQFMPGPPGSLPGPPVPMAMPQRPIQPARSPMFNRRDQQLAQLDKQTKMILAFGGDRQKRAMAYNYLQVNHPCLKGSLGRAIAYDMADLPRIPTFAQNLNVDPRQLWMVTSLGDGMRRSTIADYVVRSKLCFKRYIGLSRLIADYADIKPLTLMRLLGVGFVR